MKLSGSLMRHAVPQIWRDPNESGPFFVNTLYTLAKYASNEEIRREALITYKNYRVASACCIGMEAIVASGSDKEIVSYFIPVMRFLTFWIEESVNCRLDLLVSGEFMKKIVPIGVKVSTMTCPAALQFMKFLHVYIDGYKRFVESCDDDDATYIVEVVFYVGALHKENEELRTLFFSILRDCAFGEHRDRYTTKWSSHCSEEWDHIENRIDQLKYSSRRAEIATKALKQRRFYDLDGRDMKEEANELLKLNLEVMWEKSYEDPLSALEHAVARSFQDAEDSLCARECKRCRTEVSNHNRDEGYMIADIIAPMYAGLQREFAVGGLQVEAELIDPNQ